MVARPLPHICRFVRFLRLLTTFERFENFLGCRQAEFQVWSRHKHTRKLKMVWWFSCHRTFLGRCKFSHFKRTCVHAHKPHTKWQKIFCCLVLIFRQFIYKSPQFATDEFLTIAFVDAPESKVDEKLIDCLLTKCLLMDRRISNALNCQRIALRTKDGENSILTWAACAQKSVFRFRFVRIFIHAFVSRILFFILTSFFRYSDAAELKHQYTVSKRWSEKRLVRLCFLCQRRYFPLFLSLSYREFPFLVWSTNFHFRFYFVFRRPRAKKHLKTIKTADSKFEIKTFSLFIRPWSFESVDQKSAHTYGKQ